MVGMNAMMKEDWLHVCQRGDTSVSPLTNV